MKHKTTGALKKTAWDLLSTIIRRVYADETGTVECYTCGRLMFWRNDGAQAGHAIPGRSGAVLLDDEILRVQCYGCNVPGRGMHHIFSTKLIKEKGMDWWECKLVESKKTMKWNRAELLEKIEHYKKLNAELDKRLPRKE